MSTRTIFLDTETTGLDVEAGHEVWDIAMIVREPSTVKHPDGPDTVEPQDAEYQWYIRPDLSCADPNALRIGRFYERTAHASWSDPASAARDIALRFDGAHIVGMVPDFDIRHLSRFLRINDQCAAHHYHLIDAETLAVGWLHGASLRHYGDPETKFAEAALSLPWNSEDVSRAVGVDPGQFDRHTAMGDARWCRAIYDAVTGGQQ